MDHEPGSGSSSSKIEELPGSGSDRREGDRESKTSQDLNTTTEQVDGSNGTDDSNRSTAVSGLQTTGGNQDADSEEDHTSEQGRPWIAVSTGNADNQQTPEDCAIVNDENSDAGTVEQGEACARMERDAADTVVKGEACEQTKKNGPGTVGQGEACTLLLMKTAADTDETTREKSLKNDHVVATVGGTEGESAAAADELDAEVRTRGSCESPVASSQYSQSSPAAVASPKVVVTRAQGAEMLCNSKSPGETSPKVPCSLGTTKSQKESTPTSEAPSMALTAETEVEVDMSEGDPSSVSASGAQEKSPKVPHSLHTTKSRKESTPTSEAPSTASTAELQVEVDMSQGDRSSVSASGAQEKSSKVPHSLHTTKSQKESTPTSEAPSTASTAETEVEVDMSQGDRRSVSASGAQEKSPKVPHSPHTTKSRKESTPTSEAPSTASTAETEVEVDMSQGDRSSVSASGAQEKSPKYSLGTAKSRKDSTPTSEAPSTASTVETEVEVDMRLGDPSSVSASGAQEKSPKYSLGTAKSRKESTPTSEAPSTASTVETEVEVDMRLGDPSSVSASGAQEKSSKYSLGTTKSRKDSTPTSESPSTASTAELQVEVDMSQGDPSSVSASGAQEKSPKVPHSLHTTKSRKESTPTSEAPSTASTAELQVEVDMSQGDRSSVSASGAQEKSSEVPEPPSTVVLGSALQKEAGLCVELSGTVSGSESRDGAFRSPEPAGKMSGSEAQGGSSVSLGPLCSVLASGALEVVPNSVVQEDVHPLSEALLTSEGKEDSVETKALTMASSCEVPKDVGSKSLDSPNTVGASERIRKFSSTDAAVRNEVSTSRIIEVEMSVGSKAPSTASASEAQKGFGISPEEIVPGAEVPRKVPALESSRTVSQGGEEKPRKFLQISGQQSETTVSDVRGSPRPRIAGGGTSVAGGDFRYDELLAKKDEELIQRDKTIAKNRKIMESRLSKCEEKCQALKQNCDDLTRENERLDSRNAELGKRCQDLEMYKTELAKYRIACARMDRSNRDLQGQLEQMTKEFGTLQDQMSLYEQQHANEQSRGGSYLDDTKAATPALLVSSLNGVKDASNNFVKVLKSSIQSGTEPDVFQYIGAVSRSGHTKFQYQAYICRVLFDGFDLLHTGVSKAVLSPTTCFRQYQLHDLKKTDTVDRLLRYDREIDPSLHEFCFEKFHKLMNGIQHLLIDKSVDLRQLVQSERHPRESKLYVSFCKLAVSVWLLQRLAFSFLHPAKPFIAQRGAPFDLNRMQSVVPLDEPNADEEDQLTVGFYVLPGFDVGNSTIPCEVYVAMK